MGLLDEPFFITNCPKCQTRRCLAVQYLGYSLTCRRCGIVFTAINTGVPPIEDPIRFSIKFNSVAEQTNVGDDFSAKRPR
jgi:hypothetical protein